MCVSIGGGASGFVDFMDHTAPLKLLGHKLSLASHTIPLAKSEFKDWTVSCLPNIGRV